MKKQYWKVIFEDLGTSKKLEATIEDKDDCFYTFKTREGNTFIINKKNIIFMKHLQERGGC